MRALSELHKMRCHGIVYAIGGSKKQETVNSSANYDQRSVLTDSQNTYDLSNNSTNVSNTSTANAWTDASVTNSSYDLSNRSVSNTSNSTNTSTANAWNDASNTNSNNVTNADFSNRSTTNTSTSTANAWNDASNSNNVTNADFSNRSTATTSTANAWTDTSNSNNVTNADFSNRSTAYSDTSNRSVSNIDSSNRSINNTMLSDSGAVAGAFGFAKSTADGALASLQSVLGLATGVVTGQQAATLHGYDFAGGLFDSALDAVNRNDARAYDAYDRAAVISRDALSMTAAQTKETFGQLQNAYADAKGTTQASQKMILAVLALAGVALLVMKKG